MKVPQTVVVAEVLAAWARSLKNHLERHLLAESRRKIWNRDQGRSSLKNTTCIYVQTHGHTYIRCRTRHPSSRRDAHA